MKYRSGPSRRQATLAVSRTSWALLARGGAAESGCQNPRRQQGQWRKARPAAKCSRGSGRERPGASQCPLGAAGACCVTRTWGDEEIRSSAVPTRHTHELPAVGLAVAEWVGRRCSPVRRGDPCGPSRSSDVVRRAQARAANPSSHRWALPMSPSRCQVSGGPQKPGDRVVGCKLPHCDEVSLLNKTRQHT